MNQPATRREMTPDTIGFLAQPVPFSLSREDYRFSGGIVFRVAENV